MPVSASILCPKTGLRLLSGMLIIVVLGIMPIPIIHALGRLPFSIEPGFYGAYAAAPRAYFTYNSVPGGSVSDTIHVTNDGLIRGTLRLYTVDAITGQTSGTSVRPLQDPQVDVGSWIQLSQQQVTLDPGQSQEVAFTLTVPRHVRSGQHGGIIVAEDMHQEHFSQSSQGHAAKINIQSFIGLGVLVNLPGPRIEHLVATRIYYDEESDHQRLLLSLGNTGTQLYHPAGSLQVSDSQGRFLQNIPITMDTFLPQTSIDFPVYIQHKALALGETYRATLHLSYEHHHILDYTTSFSVPLPKKEVFGNVVQRLISPPGGNIFSILTPWHYIIGLSVLFLILSAFFFWGMKIQKAIRRMLKNR